MEGEKPLGLLGRLESTHLPFPLARRRMRRFYSIVGVTLGRVSHVAEAGSDRGRIAFSPSVMMHNGCRPCSCRSLRKNRSAVRRSRRDCTRMSITSPSWSTARQRYCSWPLIRRKTSSVVAEASLSSPQLADIVCAELLTPQPNRFIGYVDSAFRQKVLDVSKAKRCLSNKNSLVIGYLS